MDRLKIEHFERDHKQPFPKFRSLSGDDCEEIRAALARTVGLAEDADGIRLLKVLDETARDTKANPCDSSFRLGQWRHLFKPTVLINWRRFQEIDEMRFEDLSAYFDDIWFQVSDDIEIFDRSFKCILLVRHWCAVRLVLFN